MGVQIFSLLVSIAAFTISLKKYKTEQLNSIYEKLFDDILLNILPSVFNDLLLDESSIKTRKKFITTINELRKRIQFFQLHNLNLYIDLRNALMQIDENFEYYCEDKKSIYISNISDNIRLLYKLIYKLSYMRTIKYEFNNITSYYEAKRKKH